jgi:hypothetical protein
MQAVETLQVAFESIPEEVESIRVYGKQDGMLVLAKTLHFYFPGGPAVGAKRIFKNHFH